jgi:phage tail sheath protein FI
MAFQLSPGVNVTEKDLTTIVPAVATTNAGIVGLFNWGPCNKRILVDSENNLVQLFGAPDDNVAEWWFSAANFLGYGNNLQVVRAKIDEMVNANGFGYTGATATVGGVTVWDSDAALIENDDKFEFADVAKIGSFVARYAGALGNTLEVQICGSATVAATGDGLAASGYTADGRDFSNWSYGDEFDAKPNSTSYVSDLGGANDEFHLVVIDKNGLLSGTRNTILEKFQGLSFLPGVVGSDGTSNYYVDRINRTSKYIAAVKKTSNTSYADLLKGSTGAWGTGDVLKYNKPGSLAATSGVTATNTSFGVGVWKLAGGKDGKVADQTNYMKVAFGQDTDSDPEGYRLFADAETVDVNLLIGGPDKTFTPATDLTTGVADLVASSIKDIVDARKDCVAFVSVPNKDPNETDQVKRDRALQYRNSIGSSSYVVIDSGYKYMYDIYNDKNRWIPLNGDIAGLCARSDSNFDPWYSPAGFNRGQVRGVIKLSFQPRQASRDVLYKNGINPVATFSGEGTVLYGDKTALAKPSAFDRINVRRLFIVLEKAISTAAKYSLFEFNDAFTRAQFRSLVEPFLRDVQARRGVIDFKVVCDEKNNTPEVIDSNRFVADIYIKPNRSINFIQLNFIATRTGVNFSEVGA